MGMSDGVSKFERLISKIPGNWEKWVGRGIGYFIHHQDPEHVSFQVHAEDDEPIAWSIRVDTNPQNVEEALEFYEEYIEPHLEDKQ